MKNLPQILPQGGGSCKVRAVVCQGVRVTYRSSMPELKNWHGRAKNIFFHGRGEDFIPNGEDVIPNGEDAIPNGEDAIPGQSDL